MSRVLLDTSVLIAGVQAKIDLTDVPGDATVSAVTLCELHHGILIASDAERPERMRALSIAQRNFDALPVDHRIAPRYGELMAKVRREKGARPGVADTLIAATALAFGLPVLTRDGDFESFHDIEVIWV